MNATTKRLHGLGQSIWLDNISRETLQSGELRKLIDEFSITGLTSNPTIFEKTMAEGSAYDDAIAELARSGDSAEDIFFSLALDDLQRAADLFRPVFDATAGVDGWASLEISPTLVHDAQASLQAAKDLHDRAKRANLFMKIPGTPEGVKAIEEAIYLGVPVNVTLLFSVEHYLAASDAYLRGVERRLAQGLPPVVESVASVFISRWDAGVKGRVPADLDNRLGLAVAQRVYKIHVDMLGSDRWRRLADAGAHPQRLLWASTGTKDASLPGGFYVRSLAAPGTINTMPEKTLRKFAEEAEIGSPLAADGGDSEAVLAQFRAEGVNLIDLASQLQDEAAAAFSKSWVALLDGLNQKMATLRA
jgi:transaldolase